MNDLIGLKSESKRNEDAFADQTAVAPPPFSESEAVTPALEPALAEATKSGQPKLAGAAPNPFLDSSPYGAASEVDITSGPRDALLSGRIDHLPSGEWARRPELVTVEVEVSDRSEASDAGVNDDDSVREREASAQKTAPDGVGDPPEIATFPKNEIPGDSIYDSDSAVTAAMQVADHAEAPIPDTELDASSTELEAGVEGDAADWDSAPTQVRSVESLDEPPPQAVIPNLPPPPPFLFASLSEASAQEIAEGNSVGGAARDPSQASPVVYSGPKSPPAPARPEPAASAAYDGDEDEVTHVYPEGNHASDPARPTPPAVPPLPGSPRSFSAPPPPPPPHHLSSRRTMPPQRISRPLPKPPHPPEFSGAGVSSPPPAIALPTDPPGAWKHRSRGARLAVLGGLFGAACIALFLWLTPKTGSLVITVAGPENSPVTGTRVFVGGEARCADSPCTITDLEAGSYLVRATADGFETTADQALEVRAGQDTTHNFTLDQAVALRATLVISRAEIPTRVFVDGAPHGELPLLLENLEPRQYTLRFEAGERYGSEEKTVTLDPGQRLEMPAITLPVRRGRVELVLDPDNKSARVALNGQMVRRFPASFELNASEKNELVATQRGFETFRRQIYFEPGKAEQQIAIKLVAESGEPPPLEPVSRSEAKPRSRARPPAQAISSKGVATLNLNSIPASTVVLNGRSLGNTPKVGVQVKSGRQSVVFIHPTKGRKQLQVKADSGETKTLSVRF